jgi:hypothetical protein
MVFCLGACSTTKITDSWQDKNYTGGPFKNILVISQFLDEEVCRMSELEQVRDLKRRGVKATAAYSILSAGGRSSVDAIDDAIDQYSFDGVLISKVGNRMEENSIDSRNACINRWDSDYRQNQRYALSPCQMGTGTMTTSIYTLETKLYSVEDRALVMTLASKTTAVRPAYDLIKEFGKVVISRLQNSGMLAKSSSKK